MRVSEVFHISNQENVPYLSLYVNTIGKAIKCGPRDYFYNRTILWFNNFLGLNEICRYARSYDKCNSLIIEYNKKVKQAFADQIGIYA